MLQLMIGILLFGIMPVCVGTIINKKEISAEILMESYVLGWVLYLAGFWPLGCLWTLVGGSLTSLSYLWLCVFIILSVTGGIKLIQTKKLQEKRPQVKDFKIKGIQMKKLSLSWIQIVTLFLIALQILSLFLYQSIDADDATYVNQTVSVWWNNRAGVYAQEGLLVDYHAQMEYFMAPWPTLCAVFSFLMQMHPTILCHSLLPVIFVILAYMVYALLGKTLFEEKKKQEFFTFLCAWIIVFGQFSTRTITTFLLLRVWQGKAILYTILLPLLILYEIQMQNSQSMSQRKKIYAKTILVILASVCVTQIGVLMDGILVGVFSLSSFIRMAMKKEWRSGIKEAIINMGVLVPDLLVGMIYMFIRGGIL